MSVRIMVAVHNGSPGTGTMELASNWADRLGGSVVGVGVVDGSGWARVVATAGTPLTGVDALEVRHKPMLARAKEHVAQLLRQLEEHCRRAAVDYQQVQQTGAPQEQILLEAQRHDVILLGKQTTPDPGLGVPARSLLENVLRDSPRPVVAVPTRMEAGRGILVAYDGSLQAARALQALMASGLTALGEVKVLSVDSESEEIAREHASRAAEYLAAHGLEAETQPKVTDRSVHQVIVNEARRQGAEMIVMGAYGRSRLAEIFLGSVSSRVIDESLVPVFLFH